MKKLRLSFVAILLFFISTSASVANTPQPLTLEGLHISYGEGSEVFMDACGRSGNFCWSGITMEPTHFEVSGEIISPRKLYPGTTSATIRVRSGEERMHSMVVRLSWYAPMVLANCNIERGDTISNEMITIKTAPYKRNNGTVFSDVSQVIGNRASRNIRTGDVISDRDLEKNFLVERRDPVVILSRSGMVTARLKGVALEGGDKGDRITVRIPKYRNDISVLVLDQGLVQVIEGL